MPRFMLLVYPGEHAGEPPPEAVAEMSKFAQELSEAGALLALDGLAPPREATRVSFHGGGEATVAPGPFAEGSASVGGYWIVRAETQEEAVVWARRAPLAAGDSIEVRRIPELEDYSPEVQAAVVELPERPPEQT